MDNFSCILKGKRVVYLQDRQMFAPQIHIKDIAHNGTFGRI